MDCVKVRSRDESEHVSLNTDSNRMIIAQLAEVSKSVQGLCERFGPSPKDENGEVQTIQWQLQQMKKDIFARMDSDIVVNQAKQLALGREDTKSSEPKAVIQSFDHLDQKILDRQTESLKRVEQGIKSILDRSMGQMALQDGVKREGSEFLPNVGAVACGQALPDTTSDKVVCHLDSSGAKIMNELASMKAQQGELLREVRQMPQLPLAPKACKDVDTAMTPIIAERFPKMDQSTSKAVTVTPTAAPTTPAPVASLPKEEKAKLKEELQTTEEEFEELEREEAEFKDEDVEVEETPLVLLESSSLASVFASDTDPQAPPYNVEEFFWKTGINQWIARSNNFANFTVAVVIFNAVYIGFDSDYNSSQNIYEADLAFQICSQFFCVYFTWELVVRFLAFEKKRNCLRDGWFKFDAFLVSTMILDTWILMPTLFVVGGGVKIPTQPLRMLRLFKLTRMARLMKAFPELVTMIKGLMRSLRAISSTMILVVLMVYVWAIMMHMLMKEETDFNNFIWTNYSLSFETMTSCIWTLLMAGTLMLDNASPLMSHLIFSPYFNYILAGFLFCCYTLMSAMCILQMLIGVLCDVVSTVKAEENNASAIGLLKQELLADLVECDDGDGKISEQELATVMEAPRSKALLKKLKVNFPFLRELQKGMYHKPGMQVPIKEVLELMVLCRGENVSTVESMAGALVTIINELSHVKIILERDINKLEHHLTADIEDLKESTEKQAASAAILENRLHEDIAHLEALESGKTEGLHDDITQMGKQLHDDIFHLEVKDAGKGCST